MGCLEPGPAMLTTGNLGYLRVMLYSARGGASQPAVARSQVVVRTFLEILFDGHLWAVEFLAWEKRVLGRRSHDIPQRLCLLVTEMTGGHLELLRKALKHCPLRLALELHDGLSEVPWFVECSHAEADVDHEFFINRSGRRKESPPCLYPGGELHGLPTRRKEITVLPNTDAVVGSMVLQYQVVCPHDRGKIVISGLGVPVGKAGTMQSVRKTSLRWLVLRIKFARLEFLCESDRDVIGLVAFGRPCLTLLEEEDRDVDRLG